jgi:hypothetical protein
MSNENGSIIEAGASRRDLLIAPLLAALPQLLLAGGAAAAPDPTKTIIVPPKDIKFEPALNAPPQSIEEAHLFSKSSEPGIYLNLTKWYPGWMSAPHYYETDRLCVVVSGTWWVTSGDTFDPNSTVPVEAGSFVHRIARTSHYDGVKAGEKEPVVIAICGMGPITFHPVDPSKPKVRKV